MIFKRKIQTNYIYVVLNTFQTSRPPRSLTEWILNVCSHVRSFILVFLPNWSLTARQSSFRNLRNLFLTSLFHRQMAHS